MRISGGDEEDRTLDLTDANRTLSQLSYAPINFNYFTRTRAKSQVFFQIYYFWGNNSQKPQPDLTIHYYYDKITSVFKTVGLMTAVLNQLSGHIYPADKCVLTFALKVYC